MSDKLDLDAIEKDVLPQKQTASKLDLDAIEKEVTAPEKKEAPKKAFELGATKFGTAEKLPVVGDILKGYGAAEKDQLLQQQIEQDTPKEDRPNTLDKFAASSAGILGGGLRGYQDLLNMIPNGGQPEHFAEDYANQPAIQALREGQPATYGAGNAGGYMVPGGVIAGGIGAAGAAVKPMIGALGEAVLGAAAKIPGGVQDVLKLAGNVALYGYGTGFAQEAGQQALNANKTGVQDPGKANEAGMQSAAAMLPLAGAMHYGGAALNKAMAKKPPTTPPPKTPLRLTTDPNIPNDVINYHTEEQIKARERQAEMRRLNPGMEDIPGTEENLQAVKHSIVLEREAKARQAQLEEEIRQKEQLKQDTKAEKKKLAEEKRKEQERIRDERIARQNQERLNIAQKAQQLKVDAAKEIEGAKQQTETVKLQGKVELNQSKAELEAAKTEAFRVKQEAERATLLEEERIAKEKREHKQKMAEENKDPTFDDALKMLDESTSLDDYVNALANATKIYKASIRNQDPYVIAAREKQFENAKLQNRAKLEQLTQADWQKKWESENAKPSYDIPDNPDAEKVFAKNNLNPEPYNATPQEARFELEAKEFSEAFDPMNEYAQMETRENLLDAIKHQESVIEKIEQDKSSSSKLLDLAKRDEGKVTSATEYWAGRKAAKWLKETNMHIWKEKKALKAMKVELARRDSYNDMLPEDQKWFAEHGTEAQKIAAKEAMGEKVLSPADQAAEEIKAMVGDKNVRAESDEIAKREKVKLSSGVTKQRNINTSDADGFFPPELRRRLDAEAAALDDPIPDWDAGPKTALDELAEYWKKANEVNELPPDEQADALKEAFPSVAKELGEAEKQLKQDPPYLYATIPGVPQLLKALAPLFEKVKKEGTAPVTFFRYLTGTIKDIQIVERNVPTLKGALRDLHGALADAADELPAGLRRLYAETAAAEGGLKVDDMIEFNRLRRISRGMNANDILNGIDEMSKASIEQRRYFVKLNEAYQNFADLAEPYLDALKDAPEEPHMLSGRAEARRVLEHYVDEAYPNASGDRLDVAEAVSREATRGFFYSLFMGKWDTHWLHALEGVASGGSAGPVEFVKAIHLLASDERVRHFNEQFHGPDAIFQIESDLGSSAETPWTKGARLLGEKVFKPYYDAVNASPTAQKVVQAIRGETIEKAFKSAPIRTQALIFEAQRLKMQPGELAHQLSEKMHGRGTMSDTEYINIMGNIASFCNDNIGQNPMGMSNRNTMQRYRFLAWMQPFTTAINNQTYRLATHLDEAATAIKAGNMKAAATSLTSFVGMVAILNAFGKGNAIPKEAEEILKRIDPTIYYDLRHLSDQLSFFAHFRNVHHVQWAVFPFLWVGDTMPEVMREQARNAQKGRADGFVGVAAMIGASNIAQTIGTAAAYIDLKRLSDAYKGEKNISVTHKGNLLSEDTRIGTVKNHPYGFMQAFFDTATTGDDPEVAEIKEKMQEQWDYRHWVKEHYPAVYKGELDKYNKRLNALKSIAVEAAGGEEAMQDPETKTRITEQVKRMAEQPDWYSMIKTLRHSEATNKEVI